MTLFFGAVALLTLALGIGVMNIAGRGHRANARDRRGRRSGALRRYQAAVSG
jgi:hypothetical protein